MLPNILEQVSENLRALIDDIAEETGNEEEELAADDSMNNFIDDGEAVDSSGVAEDSPAKANPHKSIEDLDDSGVAEDEFVYPCQRCIRALKTEHVLDATGLQSYRHFSLTRPSFHRRLVTSRIPFETVEELGNRENPKCTENNEKVLQV